MDVAELHRRTVRAWLRRLQAVPATAWRDPTPCSDWDVRQLVAHVVGEELWTVPLLAGLTIEEVGDRFAGDVLGEDPLTAGAAAAAAAADAADRADPHASVNLSYGKERVEEYLRQLSADHLVHGWDLAAATGGDRDLDGELVAEVAGWFAAREEVYRAAGLVGPRMEGATDPQSALLAAFGRDPDWTPAT